jgi:hypothetical protein
MKTEHEGSGDPRHHAAKVGGMLDDVIKHLREDVDKVDDRAARVLFEASAEILLGMRTAFKHFEKRSEAAMR